jgi:4a-hydroxytetrahydrobiopterin dehydratase
MTDKETASMLAGKKCEACQPGMPAVDDARAAEYLKALPGWERRGSEIVKQFNFKNYYETMSFVNAVAWIANTQDHHPDLEVGYNKCRVRYSTHAVKGLSPNDFICAAKIEQLFA